MTKQQENRAFAKMIKEFPKAFGRISLRERLMLRMSFSYVVEEVIADIKANFDYVLEGKDLEIKTLGERCNQLLKDKGDLIDQIEEMKCCENCKHKKSEVDNCELLMYSLNACLCKNKDKWELRR